MEFSGINHESQLFFDFNFISVFEKFQNCCLPLTDSENMFLNFKSSRNCMEPQKIFVFLLYSLKTWYIQGSKLFLGPTRPVGRVV